MSTNYPQSRRSRSYSTTKHREARDAKRTYSDASNLVKHPDVEGIRNVHAQAFNLSFAGRRRESERGVASRTPQRRHSDSRTHMTRKPEEVAHESRSRGDTEHRHGSHRVQREEGTPRGDVAYVSRTRSREEIDRDRAQHTGRSKTAREASRPRPERSHREYKEHTGRHSERRTSREGGADHLPLRREKRSVAEGTDKRPKEAPPIRRYRVISISKRREQIDNFHLEVHLSWVAKHRPYFDPSSSAVKAQHETKPFPSTFRHRLRHHKYVRRENEPHRSEVIGQQIDPPVYSPPWQVQRFPNSQNQNPGKLGPCVLIDLH